MSRFDDRLTKLGIDIYNMRIYSGLEYEYDKISGEMDLIIVDDNDNHTISRDLNGFDIYRDNNLIASVDSDIYSYIDQPLENGTTYCYYVVANYDEGDSQPTGTVCAAPDAGPMCPPENLILNIEDGDTDIDLLWDFPDPNCEDGDNDGRIEGFNIYRDDVLIDWVPTEQNIYTDSEITFGQEYCYKVKAVYEEGESNPTKLNVAL